MIMGLTVYRLATQSVVRLNRSFRENACAVEDFVQSCNDCNTLYNFIFTAP